MRDEQDQIVEGIAAHVDSLNAIDHVVLAALRRSEAVMDGFVLMVEHRNRFCAVPLVRLQVDSAMRVFAFSIVDDPTDLGLHLLEGNSLSGFKDRSGNRLTDSFLHAELTKKYPLISQVYQHTSGFVHLSAHHLVGVLKAPEIIASGKVSIANICEPVEWVDEDVQGTFLDFLWATNALIEECKDVRGT